MGDFKSQVVKNPMFGTIVIVKNNRNWPEPDGMAGQLTVEFRSPPLIGSNAYDTMYWTNQVDCENDGIPQKESC